MKHKIVHGGKLKWRRDFASLSVQSAPFFKRLFGPNYNRVLQELYLQDEKNVFNRRNCYFALVKGKPKGQAVVYTHEQAEGTLLPMAIDFIMIMGVARALIQTPSLLRLDKHMAHTEPKWSYLCNFAVDPSARGRGLGTSIMVRACADAREAGQEYMSLDVETDNDRARRLYENLGFKKFGHRYELNVRGEPVEFFRMKKEL